MPCQGTRRLCVPRLRASVALILAASPLDHLMSSHLPRPAKKMPDQPIPNLNDEDVVRIARRDFGDERLPEVLALLSRYGPEQGRERPRVRLGVLRLAAGDVAKLPACLERARMDYRDVIMNAEMPNYPFGEKDEALAQATVNRDWKSYCEWLDRKNA
jgi:hypothetical protein